MSQVQILPRRAKGVLGKAEVGKVSRPVIPKDPSEQLTLLSRMLRQVDVDARYKPKRRKLLKAKITALMTEFQKEVNGHDGANGSQA